MKGKKARRTQSVTIRRKDYRVVEISFSGIPGDRDLQALEDALTALGYDVSVDLRLPVDHPGDDEEPAHWGSGTEDVGPADSAPSF